MPTLPGHAQEAAPLVFRRGPLLLNFDPATGNLLQLTCAGRQITRANPRAASTTFSFGDSPDKVIYADQANQPPRKLVGHKEVGPDAIELTVRMGDYELIERYRLLTAPAPRIDRSLTLANRGKETVKLRSVSLRTIGVIAEGDGLYRFPTAWPPKEHPFAQLKPGQRASGHGNLATAVAQLPGGKSLLFASLADDNPGIEIIEGAGQFDVRQSLAAAGYLRPNQPQAMGFVSLMVVDGTYWTALPRFWDWMDSVGLKVPADQAKWMRHAVLYSFHPGGTIGSNFKDLGGFEQARQRLLPTLSRLGVDAIWIMPIEYRSPYHPLDYYRLADGLGTGEQYKALVADAHHLGLKVIQDIVPHGGAPDAVHNIAHPEFMLHREDGSTLTYWLNDFALPAWQKFIADVGAHYVRTYDVDGYRVDACYGSKESNWNPDVPYARASLAGLRGGLDLVAALRKAVRALKPVDGAILGEVESARHLGVCDSVYDFNLCYNLLHQWRKTEAADFARNLTEYFEEQKYAEPRGAVRLRHVESHDALRSELWHGVDGMHAMYALTAWIDGMPLMYHNMEIGHDFALAQINALRKARPELSEGEALYRAATCDAPGVFTCVRKLGERVSVVVINFNREPVRAKITWPGGSDAVDLKPMGYTLLPNPPAEATAVPPSAPKPRQSATLDDAVRFDGATEWFADTIEGRLCGYVPPAWPSPSGPPAIGSHSIYWRKAEPEVIWSSATHPLMPGHPRVGFKATDGAWHVYELAAAQQAADLKLVTWHDNANGLWLTGGKGLAAQRSVASALPPAPDVTIGTEIGGVRLRVVGSQYIVSNAHYTLTLQRQGGAIARLERGGHAIVTNLELYGDQEAFASREEKRMSAGADVECGIRVATDDGKLRLTFEGQLRGNNRFSLRRPPVWYRNRFTFDASPKIEQAWAFKAERTIKGQKAFLAFYAPQVDGGHFRFLHGGQVLAEADLESEGGRQGQTKGKPTPDTIEVSGGNGGSTWKLTSIRVPDGLESNLFFSNRGLFIAALDGGTPVMEQGRWFEFGATWE